MTNRFHQGICVLVAAAVMASLSAAHAGAQTQVIRPTRHPQLSWAHVGRKPLSDADAASLVTREPEVRPDNQSANRYRPTNVDLRAFRTARNGFHQTPVQADPWNAYVTGRTDLRRPTTDMIIQWAAHKWGIPENTLRALGSREGGWHMEWSGDLTKVPSRWYMRYPPQARSTGGSVWQSMGITQIRWKPDGSVNSGTQRLRWTSTAFNLDYAAATIRYYYDGKCKWCGRGYHAGQQWGSIGAWNQPTPWGNRKARWYISKVKEALAMHGWTRPGW